MEVQEVLARISAKEQPGKKERVTVRRRPHLPSIVQILDGDMIEMEMTNEKDANRYAAGLRQEIVEKEGK